MASTPPVIGIAGLAGSGKDTIAQRLVDRWGYLRVAMADALKDEVRRILPRTLEALSRLYIDADELPLSVDKLLAVKPYAIRCLLQEWGTDLRRHENPEYWVEQHVIRVMSLTGGWEKSDEPTRVVIPDIRFDDEYRYVLSQGGQNWLVQRPGTAAPNDHPSETLATGNRLFDWMVVNDTTIERLWEHVDARMEAVGG